MGAPQLQPWSWEVSQYMDEAAHPGLRREPLPDPPSGTHHEVGKYNQGRQATLFKYPPRAEVTIRRFVIK